MTPPPSISTLPLCEWQWTQLKDSRKSPATEGDLVRLSIRPGLNEDKKMQEERPKYTGINSLEGKQDKNLIHR